MKEHSSQQIEETSYPKNIIISKGVAIGNDAIWEFKQGDIQGWNGEYNLNVYFKIQKPIEELRKIELSYYVYPTIIINGKPFTVGEKGEDISGRALVLIGVSSKKQSTARSFI